MDMKRFTVELTTKGSFNVEINPVEVDGLDLEQITEEDADELLFGSDYITCGAFSDDYRLPFSLVVHDENENEVFRSEDSYDFKFVHDAESILEDEDFTSHADLTKAVQAWEKRWAEEENAVETGIYVVGWHEMRWLTFRFVIEDEAFDPSKLFFVSDKRLEGLVYDEMTNPNHIFYDDHFVEAEDCNEDTFFNEYGTYFHIMKRCEEGYWDDLREIED